MGRQPKMLAQSNARVSVVACHPVQPVVAVGFSDGAVLMVRLDDGALIHVARGRRATGQRLGLGSDRRLLAFGTETGDAGVLGLCRDRSPQAGEG